MRFIDDIDGEYLCINIVFLEIYRWLNALELRLSCTNPLILLVE